MPKIAYSCLLVPKGKRRFIWGELAGPTRLELATSGVTGRRSNQLNYDPAMGWHIIENCFGSFKPPALAHPSSGSFAVVPLAPDILIAPRPRKAYTKVKGSTQSGQGRDIMARMTRMEKFKAKMDIEMDHIRAALMELRAKAKEAKLDARLEFEKGLDALEKNQGDLKAKLDEWAKTGMEAGGEIKKGIKRSAKDLKKSVKKAYKTLT